MKPLDLFFEEFFFNYTDLEYTLNNLLADFSEEDLSNLSSDIVDWNDYAPSLLVDIVTLAIRNKYFKGEHGGMLDIDLEDLYNGSARIRFSHSKVSSKYRSDIPKLIKEIQSAFPENVSVECKCIDL